MKKNGISLLVLVVTICVVIILVGAIALSLANGRPFDSAKKARFFNDLSSIEDGAKLKAVSQYADGQSMEKVIQNAGEVTTAEKDYILANIPTLDESIKLVNDGKDMYQSKLYWLSEQNLKDLGISSGDKTTKYLIDMDTLIPYDYEGKQFDSKTWHTIRYGAGDGVVNVDPGQEQDASLPDGWMRLILHYPEGSIDRQWRMAIPGEVRDNASEDWKFYTEPILLKIENIPYVIIKYSLNGEEIMLADPGKVAVDIYTQPALLTDKVTVTVNYDSGCINKQYKIGDGGWKTYTGSFVVTEDVLIQARADKEVDLKDTLGNVIGTTTISGQDKYQIKKAPEKKVPDLALRAPTINKLAGVGFEKARITIDYPTDLGNIIKIYKLNSGEEIPYTGEFPILEYGTQITAYYYKEDGTLSSLANLTINDETKLDVKIFTEPDPQINNAVFETKIAIEYDERATSKTYKIDSGAEMPYTGTIVVDKTCTVTAYARKDAIQAIDTKVIEFAELRKPEITYKISADKKKATVSIKYDASAVEKVYNIDGGETLNYTEPFEVSVNGTVIYAMNKNAKGDIKDITKTIEGIEAISKPVITQRANVDQTAAQIIISYDPTAVTKQYSINGGPLQNYTSPFEVAENGTVIRAVNTNANNESNESTLTVNCIHDLTAPVITRQLSTDKLKATISIKYDATAVIKQYSINGGPLQDYTAPFDVTDNGTVIYAINTDAKNASKDATYTVTGIVSIVKPVITGTLSADKTKCTISIVYDPNAVTKQYIINNGSLTNYTTTFDVTENGTVVYATNTNAKGESEDASYTVSGIGATSETPDTLKITAPVITSQLSTDKSKFKITIKYDANAVTKQYSINGGTLQNYTAPFDVTENGTVIYAINTDANSQSKDATYNVDGIVKKLDVTIIANPDTIQEVASVNVTINYDSRATSKQYSINGGTLQNYTAPFNITENSTIKAVADFTNGSEVGHGEATKQIDNLPTGISAPVFTVTKNIETQGEYAVVSIEFDKKSVSNTYCINGGDLKIYSGPIEVRDNDTVITAYNVDSFGNSQSAQQIITGLARYLLIAKDKYYHIVLPYPTNTINHEYRYTSANPWKTYPEEDGFILVKSQYEAELTAGGKIVKLEVSPGNYVDFDGHWYIVDENFMNLAEDIDMRWGYAEGSDITRVPLQIIPSTKQTTDKVDIFIVYPSTAISKQYKINNGTYQNYTGKLTITDNNTTIYAKTQYADGTWSEEKSYTITNIVSSIPDGVITMTPSTSAWTNGNVTADITFQPISSALKKKYKTLINGTDSGWMYVTENTAQVTLTQNGIVFAAFENNVGDSSEPVTLNVANIDKTAPTVTYGVNGSSGGTISTSVTVTDTGAGLNASTLQYVWDTQNATTPSSGWATFTNGQTLTQVGSEGTYYLWIKASDNLGNNTVSKTNSFVLSANIFNFAYTGNYQTWTAPSNGTFKLEVWGAQGGNGNQQGGNGGYSTGNIALNAGDILYIYVGGKGALKTAGWNGGGAGGNGGSNADYGTAGGGATDIRFRSGTWNNSTGLSSRIIVAGGGGGYDNNGGSAGVGGGTSGTKNASSAGTQSSGYSFGGGQSGPSYASGGGGGWYGGYAGIAGSGNNSGAGGSGYTLTSSSYKPSGYTPSSKYYLTSVSTIAGNTSFAAPGGGSEVGHTGNGYARISVL